MPVSRLITTRNVAAAAVLAMCLPPANSAAAQSASQPLIVAICAPCHGYDGVGRDVQIPRIAGQSAIYLKAQLHAFRRGARKHPDMSMRAEDLTDRDIDELAGFYAILPPG